MLFMEDEMTAVARTPAVPGWRTCTSQTSCCGRGSRRDSRPFSLCLDCSRALGLGRLPALNEINSGVPALFIVVLNCCAPYEYERARSRWARVDEARQRTRKTFGCSLGTGFPGSETLRFLFVFHVAGLWIPLAGSERARSEASVPSLTWRKDQCRDECNPVPRYQHVARQTFVDAA